MFPGMGMPPGMGMGMGMGGMGMGMGMDAGMGNMMLPPVDPFAQYQETFDKIAAGLVGARVRTRALLELLEEKGVLGPGEFDGRAQAIWERDYSNLADELLTPAAEEPAEQEPLTPPQPKAIDAQEYAAEILHNYISEMVGSRVRMRTVLDLLEEKGIFQPGEFDARADAIWERDYEELAMDFYKLSF